MPPQSQRRKRAAPPNDEDITPRRQSRRAPASDESGASEGEQDDQDVDMDASNDGAQEQMVRKLVRYALACEYARVPIRRDGIREKVLGNSNPRAFKQIFDGAQAHLRQVFGMAMEELPVREKRTLKEKQKATARKATAASQSSSSVSSRQYILVSVLPAEFRTQTIISPSHAPSPHDEAAYVAIYTTMICLITLSGGELSDMKLKRHLTRFNAAQNLPMDKTDNVLQKMVRHGYLDKVTEKSDGDDDSVTWYVGGRGKVEVPPASIAAFATKIWADPPDDFESKLHKSLGLKPLPEAEEE